jgi:hypothetical protein
VVAADGRKKRGARVSEWLDGEGIKREEELGAGSVVGVVMADVGHGARLLRASLGKTTR